MGFLLKIELIWFMGLCATIAQAHVIQRRAADNSEDNTKLEEVLRTPQKYIIEPIPTLVKISDNVESTPYDAVDFEDKLNEIEGKHDETENLESSLKFKNKSVAIENEIKSELQIKNEKIKTKSEVIANIPAEIKSDNNSDLKSASNNKESHSSDLSASKTVVDIKTEDVTKNVFSEVEPESETKNLFSDLMNSMNDKVLQSYAGNAQNTGNSTNYIEVIEHPLRNIVNLDEENISNTVANSEQILDAQTENESKTKLTELKPVVEPAAEPEIESKNLFSDIMNSVDDKVIQNYAGNAVGGNSTNYNEVIKNPLRSVELLEEENIVKTAASPPTNSESNADIKSTQTEKVSEIKLTEVEPESETKNLFTDIMNSVDDKVIQTYAGNSVGPNSTNYIEVIKNPLRSVESIKDNILKAPSSPPINSESITDTKTAQTENVSEINLPKVEPESETKNLFTDIMNSVDDKAIQTYAGNVVKVNSTNYVEVIQNPLRNVVLLEEENILNAPSSPPTNSESNTDNKSTQTENGSEIKLAELKNEVEPASETKNLFSDIMNSVEDKVIQTFDGNVVKGNSTNYIEVIQNPLRNVELLKEENIVKTPSTLPTNSVSNSDTKSTQTGNVSEIKLTEVEYESETKNLFSDIMNSVDDKVIQTYAGNSVGGNSTNYIEVIKNPLRNVELLEEENILETSSSPPTNSVSNSDTKSTQTGNEYEIKLTQVEPESETKNLFSDIMNSVDDKVIKTYAGNTVGGNSTNYIEVIKHPLRNVEVLEELNNSESNSDSKSTQTENESQIKLTELQNEVEPESETKNLFSDIVNSVDQQLLQTYAGNALGDNSTNHIEVINNNLRNLESESEKTSDDSNRKMTVHISKTTNSEKPVPVPLNSEKLGNVHVRNSEKYTTPNSEKDTDGLSTTDFENSVSQSSASKVINSEIVAENLKNSEKHTEISDDSKIKKTNSVITAQTSTFPELINSEELAETQLRNFESSDSVNSVKLPELFDGLTLKHFTHPITKQSEKVKEVSEVSTTKADQFETSSTASTSFNSENLVGTQLKNKDKLTANKSEKLSTVPDKKISNSKIPLPLSIVSESTNSEKLPNQYTKVLPNSELKKLRNGISENHDDLNKNPENIEQISQHNSIESVTNLNKVSETTETEEASSEIDSETYPDHPENDLLTSMDTEINEIKENLDKIGENIKPSSEKFSGTADGSTPDTSSISEKIVSSETNTETNQSSSATPMDTLTDQGISQNNAITSVNSATNAATSETPSNTVTSPITALTNPEINKVTNAGIETSPTNTVSSSVSSQNVAEISSNTETNLPTSSSSLNNKDKIPKPKPNPVKDPLKKPQTSSNLKPETEKPVKITKKPTANSTEKPVRVVYINTTSKPNKEITPPATNPTKPPRRPFRTRRPSTTRKPTTGPHTTTKNPRNKPQASSNQNVPVRKPVTSNPNIAITTQKPATNPGWFANFPNLAPPPALPAFFVNPFNATSVNNHTQSTLGFGILAVPWNWRPANITNFFTPNRFIETTPPPLPQRHNAPVATVPSSSRDLAFWNALFQKGFANNTGVFKQWTTPTKVNITSSTTNTTAWKPWNMVSGADFFKFPKFNTTSSSTNAATIPANTQVLHLYFPLKYPFQGQIVQSPAQQEKNVPIVNTAGVSNKIEFIPKFQRSALKVDAPVKALDIIAENPLNKPNEDEKASLMFELELPKPIVQFVKSLMDTIMPPTNC